MLKIKTFFRRLTIYIFISRENSVQIEFLSVGTAPPIINNLSIVKLRVNKDTNTIEKLHIRADVTYTGCGRLALQAGTLHFYYHSIMIMTLE